TLLAVRADPAIERDARIGPLAAIWMGIRLAGQLAHQLATFSWSKARVGRRGDHGIAEQGDGFAWIGAHEYLRVPSGNEHHPIRSAPRCKGRASVGPQRLADRKSVV